MPRQVSLLIKKRSPFKAHWLLWIPSCADPNIGKLIEVEGDVRNGFTLKFTRNCNLNIETAGRITEIVPISQVADEYVLDTPGDGDLTFDTTPRDVIEEVAVSVKPPGPSMNPIGASERPRGIVKLKDCQDWIIDLVGELVKRGIMSKDADQVVKNAPQH